MDYDREIERLDRLAGWMDDLVSVPGTNIRVGLDGLAGLLPVVGDSATMLVSLYLVARAQRMGAPGRLLARMVGNVGVDWLVGSVPVLGDLFDIGWKANRRNVGLLKAHFNYPHGPVPPVVPEAAETSSSSSS